MPRPRQARPRRPERYDARLAGNYCHQHYGKCLSSCPEQLAINDVLRSRMSFEDSGREKAGMRLYAALDHEAQSGLWLPDPPRTLGADRLLRLPRHRAPHPKSSLFAADEMATTAGCFRRRSAESA